MNLYSKSPVLGEPLGIPPIILFTAEREGNTHCSRPPLSLITLRHQLLENEFLNSFYKNNVIGESGARCARGTHGSALPSPRGRSAAPDPPYELESLPLRKTMSQTVCRLAHCFAEML
jgi:hypothetical protein